MKETSRVIIVYKDKVLMGLRAEGYEADKWDIPGGKIDQGEDPLMAVVREAEEETGIVVDGLEFFKEDLDGEWLSHYFIFHLSELNHDLQGDNEHSQLSWFSEEDIEDIKEEIAFNHYLILKDFFSR